MSGRLRTIVLAAAGAALLFGAAYGLLAVGMRTPSASERMAVRILATLLRTRGVRADLTIDGRALGSTCHAYLGRDLVEVSDGSRVVIVGVHAFRTLAPAGALVSEVSRRRALFGHRATGSGRLVGVEAAIAGSHALWARILAVRLEQADIHLRPTVFRGRPAYALLLGHRPRLDLVVDRKTLLPVAAFYRSRSIVAASRLLASRHPVHGC